MLLSGVWWGGLFSIVWLISMLFAKVKTISSASSEQCECNSFLMDVTIAPWAYKTTPGEYQRSSCKQNTQVGSSYSAVLGQQLFNFLSERKVPPSPPEKEEKKKHE